MNINFIALGFIFFLGWILFFFFGRQIIYNVKVAYPLIKSIKATDSELIAGGAKRYTNISMIICVLILAAVIAAILKFCKAYMIIAFFVGFAICFFMLIGKISLKSKDYFENFCATYYGFITDDELRTAMYNKKVSQMKLRLHDMGLSTEFIPSFK